jgi:hypothetical protein
MDHNSLKSRDLTVFHRVMCYECKYQDDWECHLNPPQMVFTVQTSRETDYRDENTYHFFPTVSGKDWCSKGELKV